tara:strand:+ start:2866 stop:3516 length:651 start_codon:yes stop_codon:yes gene_type:complete
MPKIELIVYDFDGTLFDTRSDIAHSVNLSLIELGLPEHPPETIFGFIGDGVISLMDRAVYGSDYKDLNRAVETFSKIYAENLVIDTVPFPNCIETVGQLASKKQAIHSNKPEQFVRDILKRFDFIQPFQTIVGGDTLERRKPDPEGLLHILHQAETSAKNALMVGDSAIDIETAKRAGVRSCGVVYNVGGRETVSKADHVINDMKNLPGIVFGGHN